LSNSPNIIVLNVAVLKMILSHGKTNFGQQFVNSLALKQQVRMWVWDSTDLQSTLKLLVTVFTLVKLHVCTHYETRGRKYCIHTILVLLKTDLIFETVTSYKCWRLNYIRIHLKTLWLYLSLWNGNFISRNLFHRWNFVL